MEQRSLANATLEGVWGDRSSSRGSHSFHSPFENPRSVTRELSCRRKLKFHGPQGPSFGSSAGSLAKKPQANPVHRKVREGANIYPWEAMYWLPWFDWLIGSRRLEYTCARKTVENSTLDTALNPASSDSAHLSATGKQY